MKTLLATVLAVASLAVLAAAQTPPPRPAPRTELMMLTGSESGTYYVIGRDIKRLLDEVAPESGIDLAVVPSQGALQNVIDVFRYGSIQLGITQSDVLAYLEIYARGDADARRVVGGLQVVDRLYEEDVYLFARPGINGIGDLTGKRVDIGPAGSGTTVTSLVLLHLAGVEPREIVNLFEPTAAITALRKGRIDAFIRVTATPADYLKENISASHGFVLVPIRLSPRPGTESLARHYTPSTIPARTYPWLDRAVDTIKVRTMLVTSGAPAGSPVCEAIGRLARTVSENGAWLQQSGHHKWKDIQLAKDVLADPRVSPCVVQAFRR